LSLPVAHVRAGLLSRMSRLFSGARPSTLPGRLAELSLALSVAPAASARLERQRGASPMPFGSLLIHASSPPQLRARLLEELAEEFSLPGEEVLALSEAEWPLCHSALGLLPLADGLWGNLPAVSPVPDHVARDRVLRISAGLYLDDLPALLASVGNREQVSRLCTGLRDLLAEVAVPARFPEVPALDASVEELYAASIGVFHAALSGEQRSSDVEFDSVDSPPARTTGAAHKLLAPLLADISEPTLARLSSLYLVPGPFGTRHRWRLLAVVPGNAPLQAAAALRRNLQQHLSMLDERAYASVMDEGRGPVVVTETALGALMGGGLFARPLSALSLRAHSQLLVGTDVLAEMPVRKGSSIQEDLHSEFAGLLLETHSCWLRDRGSLAVRDLLFGAWPSVLHLARGGSPSASLASIHEELRRSTDPALSRVGSAASSQGWGDPSCVDLSRSRELLREWGPTLLRLQEATMEAME
jgi:hypothetical protein